MSQRICLLLMAGPVLMAAQAPTTTATGEPASPDQQVQEQAQVPEVLPNAGALVRKSLHATGELAALKTVQARTLIGSIKLPGREEPGTLRIVQARPNLFLETSSVPGIGDTEIGSDGTTVWMTHPTVGAQVLEGVVAAQERIRNAFDFGLHSRKHVRTMETVARLSFDERDCYQVRCELVPFVFEGVLLDSAKTLRYRTFTEYYEVESGLLRGVEAFLATPLGDRASTTIYRDYKELAKGVKVATQLITKFGDQEVVATITALNFDPVEAAFFAPPASILSLAEQGTAPLGEQGGDDSGQDPDDGDDDDDAGGGDSGAHSI